MMSEKILTAGNFPQKNSFYADTVPIRIYAMIICTKIQGYTDYFFATTVTHSRNLSEKDTLL